MSEWTIETAVEKIERLEKMAKLYERMIMDLELRINAVEEVLRGEKEIAQMPDIPDLQPFINFGLLLSLLILHLAMVTLKRRVSDLEVKQSENDI